MFSFGGQMLKRIVLFAVFSTGFIQLMGQTQSASFNSLELPVHASISALGGLNVSKGDYAISYFQNNPALANDTLNGRRIGHG